MAAPRIDEGKYEILQKLKEGGMGAIYKVRHRLLDEIRVIKVIRSGFADDEELRSRFFREARTATRLRHPRIAHLFDFTVGDDGSAYIVMEFIDGVTLQELLAKHGPVGTSLTLEIADQALEALGYLHQHGFIHRDVAPDNLMLTRGFDRKPLVKLIDLGIAKRLEGHASRLTVEGAFLGKVRYSSPEQFERDGGAEAVDARSDVYSFAVLLYELLTGHSPIEGDTMDQLIAGHLFRPPRPFAETDPQGRVPEGLREVVLAGLAKDPAERIAGAAEMREALRPFRGPMDELGPHLERTLFEATRLVSETAGEGSSIQRRVDAGFAADRTPAGATPLPAADGNEATAASTTAHARALLENARLLTRLEQFDKAEHELDRLKVLAPEHPGVSEIEEVIERGRGMRREAEAKRSRSRREQLDALLEEAQTLAAGGELGEARERLREVVRLDPSHTAARRLLRTLADDDEDDAEAEAQRAEEARRAARLKDLLADARRLSGEDDLEGALAAFDRALEIDPESPAADERAALAAEIERRREAERRRQEEVAAAVAAISGRLVEEDLAGARRLLAAARYEHGAAASLEAVAQRLEALEGSRRARLDGHRNDAREALSAGDLDAAAAAVDALESLQPYSTDAAELRREIADERRRREEEEAAAQRRQRVEQAAAGIAATLARGDLERAAQELDFARSRFPEAECEALEEVAGRLAEARRSAGEETPAPPREETAAAGDGDSAAAATETVVSTTGKPPPA